MKRLNTSPTLQPWTTSRCVGWKRLHGHRLDQAARSAELQPPPRFWQEPPGSFKANDNFVTNFNQPQMLPCVSMWSLQSHVPTHYKCLLAPHLSCYKKKQPKLLKAIHPSSRSQVTLLRPPKIIKNPKQLYTYKPVGKSLFEKPHRELGILKKCMMKLTILIK